MADKEMKKYPIGRTEKTAIQAATMEKSKIYGDAFEDWVKENLFPQYLYEALEFPPETELGGRYVMSRERPDFRFRDRLTGHIFWVETKYRSNLSTDIWIMREEQLRRYRRFQENVKPETVFFILGFGGKPWNPKDVFVLPINKLQSHEADLSFLEPYKIYPPAKYYRGKLV